VLVRKEIRTMLLGKQEKKNKEEEKKAKKKAC
jgi:hypothetical protein